ncbi:hypothetical protein M0R04_14960 [Candidatus Dojkabacteria bacterium]|jgi:hypothetical protein|nr:hypothetical protein [Candidatus Dojkabacteria bacterium]
MEIIKAAKSSDGTLFETEEACLAYESRYFPGNLTHHISKHLKSDYCDDWGVNVIDIDGVQLYITEYWEDLKNIMATKPVPIQEQINYSRILPKLPESTDVQEAFLKYKV